MRSIRRAVGASHEAIDTTNSNIYININSNIITDGNNYENLTRGKQQMETILH